MGFEKVDSTSVRRLTGHFDPANESQQAEIAGDSRGQFFLRGFREGKWRRHVNGR